MISFLSGKIAAKKPQFVILETNGIGFKVFIPSKAFYKLPKIGSRTKLFCYTHIKQDGMELYGFLKNEELEMFELLISISGVGPKIALKILNIGKTDELLSAISCGRTDILTKSGIGTKTAQRLVLELKDKIIGEASTEILSLTDSNYDIEKALRDFGYKKYEIEEAIKNIPSEIKNIEDRLRIALKNLAKK